MFLQKKKKSLPKYQRKCSVSHHYKKSKKLKKITNKWTSGKDNNLAENIPLFLGDTVININQAHNTPYSLFCKIFTEVYLNI